MRKTITTAAIAAMVLTATAALAGPTPQQKCQAAKNSAAGKYAACRQSAEKGLVGAVDSTKYDAAIAKCEEKFADAWQKAIDGAASAGATCPDAPLAAGDFKSVIDTHTGNISAALGGGALNTYSCGNGTIEAGEDCDFGTLGGQTCNSATAAAEPFGQLACGVGCAFNTSGCLPCPGLMYGGACWVSPAAKGASCTDRCASAGLSYDPATKTIAGSDASDADCLALVQAMFPTYTSPPYPEALHVQGISSSGVGCGVFNLPTILHDTNPTTGDSVDPQVGRICACH
jgi:hypothetical protein